MYRFSHRRRAKQQCRAFHPPTDRPTRELPPQAMQTVLRLQRTMTNRTATKTILVQPRLKVSSPGDRYEREADRVAEQVIRMPAPVHILSGKQDLKQTAKTSHITTTNSGRPLTRSERSFFEPRFGVNFSAVRIHDNARAASLAASIQAQAFTYGPDVVFAAGEYSTTPAGRKLLAHELTHVVQQGGGTTGSNLAPRKPAISSVSGGRQPLMRKASFWSLIINSYGDVNTALSYRSRVRNLKDLFAANSRNLKYVYRAMLLASNLSIALDKRTRNFDLRIILQEYWKLAARKDIKGLLKVADRWDNYAKSLFKTARFLRKRGLHFQKLTNRLTALINVIWTLMHVPLALGGKPWEYFTAYKKLSKLQNALRIAAGKHLRLAKKIKIAEKRADGVRDFFNKKANQLIDAKRFRERSMRDR